jgi:hypothetical protein
MEPANQFRGISTNEEFFTIFQGLCNIAEKSFNQFEGKFKNIETGDRSTIIQYCRELSYLMSITFVIIGMRGNYPSFREGILVFYTEVDGVSYDQDYLYKMNDYFIERFDRILTVLKTIDPLISESYRKIWNGWSGN